MEQVGQADTPERRVLWIPGNDLGTDFYRPAAALLAERGVASHLVSLPGVGNAEPMSEPSWDRYVERLETARQEVGAGVVLGHSMGAIMAVLTAIRAGSDLRGLVLVEPSLPPTAAAARRVAAQYTGTVVDGQRETFCNEVHGVRRVAHLDKYPQEAIDMYMASRRASYPATARTLFATAADIYPIPWHRLVRPTLVLRGRGSGPTMWLLSRLLWWQLPAAEFQSVSNAGHFLFREADGPFAEHLGGFLNRLTPPAQVLPHG